MLINGNDGLFVAWCFVLNEIRSSKLFRFNVHTNYTFIYLLFIDVKNNNKNDVIYLIESKF